MVISRLGILIGALFLAATVAALRPGSSARAAEKGDTWVQVRSPHFTVVSNGGEKQARRVAEHFEQVRAAFQKALNNIRVDSGKPIIILAAKNEATLRALLPEYWEQKGHMHPAGLFVPREEKNYVALRLDAEGDNPYQVLYHEYVHLLIRLNFREIPLWLDEGYAEFFANSRISEKDMAIGEPSREHILRLRETSLLPLELLLKVDHRSPYYNEANKSSIFYAQSWALVHYLMLDEQMLKEQRLAKFGRLIASGTDDVEAARQAFGDLKELEKKMGSYVRQANFHFYYLKASAEVTEKSFEARALAPAESAALRGDFQVHRGRLGEAAALLEEALRLDPNLALANESMGFLFYQQRKPDEARKYLARAVELDSRSHLAHYYYAMLMLTGRAATQTFPEVEASLRRATELNPEFAPAYSALSFLYSARRETYDKALAAANRAAQLEPGQPQHLLNLGRVLLLLDRVEEARAVGRSVLAAARSPDIQSVGEAFLQQVSQHEEFLAQRKRYDEEARAAREQLQAQVSTESQVNPPAKPDRPAESTQTPASVAEAKPRPYSAFGRITEVSCASPPAMNLTLSLGALVMRLHATNFFKVDYLTTSWKPPANFNPCTHLKGLSAQLSYTLVQGQDYDGEIASVEVRK